MPKEVRVVMPCSIKPTHHLGSQEVVVYSHLEFHSVDGVLVPSNNSPLTRTLSALTPTLPDIVTVFVPCTSCLCRWKVGLGVATLKRAYRKSLVTSSRIQAVLLGT
eukprot:6033180-Amphidinium_carterae.1